MSVLGCHFCRRSFTNILSLLVVCLCRTHAGIGRPKSYLAVMRQSRIENLHEQILGGGARGDGDGSE